MCIFTIQHQILSLFVLSDFFLVLFLGLKNLKSLPKTFEKPPITIYGDDPLPLTITPNHRVDMDGRTDIRPPPIPSVSLSPLTALLRGLCLFIFFSITPLLMTTGRISFWSAILDNNWSLNTFLCGIKVSRPII